MARILAPRGATVRCPPPHKYMKPLTILGGAAALVALTSFVTATIVAPAQEREAPGAQAPDMDPELMAEMMRLGMPGEHHEQLKSTVGTWDNAYKMRMAPEAPWMETTGTTTRTELLGGRYVMEEVEMSVMGMPMNGISIYGYDNNKEEWINLWMDSMSTWPIESRGQTLEDGTIEMKGTMIDVAGERPFRMVIKPQGADERTVEMYDTIPPHGEVMVMEIHSTRAGSR